MIRFSGVELGEACTVVIRGATRQILDEAQRSLHDALCVLIQTVKESRIVYGGGEKKIEQIDTSLCTQSTGCSELLMASAVQDLAAKTPGKESMAMEAFAKALRQVQL